MGSLGLALHTLALLDTRHHAGQNYSNLIGCLQSALTLQYLLFSISLHFFLIFLVFCVFLCFSKDLKGSTNRKTLAFFVGFPCFFQESKGWRVRVYLSSEMNCLKTYLVCTSEHRCESRGGVCGRGRGEARAVA